MPEGNLKRTTQSTINSLVKKGQKDKAKQMKTDIEAMYGVTGLNLPLAKKPQKRKTRRA